MPRHSFFCTFITAVCTLFLCTDLYAQGLPTLKSILNVDGTLRPGGSGSYDVHGWRMSTGRDGRPRFHRADEEAERPVPSAAEGWDNGIGNPGVDGAPIRALAVDGDNLYVGGTFSYIGTVQTNNIALWNMRDRTWKALGTGTSFTVQAIAIHNGDIVIGGLFVQADGNTVNNVARWNGTEWVAMGDGLDDRVHVLLVVDNQLYAGGDFTYSGDFRVSGIARWDGNTWRPLGTGVDGPVYALAYDGIALYAGGSFESAGNVSVNNIACWNGSRWEALGDGLSSGVYALAVVGSTLYAGGDFFYSGETDLNFIGQYNGVEWMPLDRGVNFQVFALAPDGNGGLYVGGNFSGAIGVKSEGIAHWYGNQWESLDGIEGMVFSLAVAEGTVFIGGRFSTVNGEGSKNLAELTSVSWSSPGQAIAGYYDYAVKALAVDGEYIYMGGNFTQAGEVDVNFIACYNISSGTWTSLGSGVNADVECLTVADGYLYAGGDFTRAGSLIVYHVARWNISDQTWENVGQGFATTISSILVDNSIVYVGAYGVYRYDGVEWTWISQDDIRGWVYALTKVDGTLYAGGYFTMGNDRNTFRSIARWNGTDTWTSVGSGTSGAIYTLAAQGDDLYAGGSFMDMGGRFAGNIARWDGTSWSALQGGTDYSVVTLSTLGTDLYAGGWFNRAGEDFIDFVARWDGQKWNALGTGTDFGVFASTTVGGSLYFGGFFATAGGAWSHGITRWLPVPLSVPDISHPAGDASTLHCTPNPFTHTTTVTFTLPATGVTSLEVYNLIGEKIATIVSETMTAGSHSFTFDGSELPAGTYRVLLRSGVIVQSTMMVVDR